MLTRITAVVHVIVLVCLAVLLAVVSYQIHTTGAKVNAALDQITMTTTEAHERMVGTSQNLNAILIQVGIASDEARRAASEQRVYWNKVGAESVLAIQKTNDVLTTAQKTLNSIDDSQKLIAATTIKSLEGVPVTIQASTNAMNEAALDLQTTNRILSDPNIPQTLAHLNETAGHLDNTSASIDTAVKRWTKPGNFFRSLFTGLLDTGSKVAVIVK
jgi:hypothetical protein